MIRIIAICSISALTLVASLSCGDQTTSQDNGGTVPEDTVPASDGSVVSDTGTMPGDAGIPADTDSETGSSSDTATASEVAYMVRVQRLRPRCVVSYRRRAFMGGRYERGMRLTFDMKLKGRVHALAVNEVARNLFFLPLDWLVMEVKVNERIPLWMVALLGKYECRLQRISKYCAALAASMGQLKRASVHKENLYG